jgi:hypothetical protein
LEEKQLPIVYKEVKDHLVGSKIDKAIDVLNILAQYSYKDLISERDLRRILFENLENLTEYHVNTVIA